MIMCIQDVPHLYPPKNELWMIDHSGREKQKCLLCGKIETGTHLSGLNYLYTLSKPDMVSLSLVAPHGLFLFLFLSSDAENIRVELLV